VIKIRKDTADKIATLNGEDEMIRKILSMLGMIEEVGPSAKGIAAGGRVVEPAQAKAINKQIANLKQAASKMGGVQMQQAARLSNLMAYQETDEVKAILLKMLEDIQTQVDTTNSLLTEAEGDLAEQKVTLNGYQETMVNLNAKHDQAAGALIAANQKRAVSSLSPFPSPLAPRPSPCPLSPLPSPFSSSPLLLSPLPLFPPLPIRMDDWRPGPVSGGAESRSSRGGPRRSPVGLWRDCLG
jgi:hypothetical protein